MKIFPADVKKFFDTPSKENVTQKEARMAGAGPADYVTDRAAGTGE